MRARAGGQHCHSNAGADRALPLRAHSGHFQKIFQG